jgi:hypothetical protein
VAEARLSPSRLIPTAIDAIITAEDRLLLAFAYSGLGDHFLLNTLLKFLGAEFGPSMPNDSLRHATIAYSAQSLPKAQFQREHYHKRQAWRALNATFETRRLPSEANAFAAFVLVMVEGRHDLGSSNHLEAIRKCKIVLESISDSGKD